MQQFLDLHSQQYKLPSSFAISSEPTDTGSPRHLDQCHPIDQETLVDQAGLMTSVIAPNQMHALAESTDPDLPPVSELGSKCICMTCLDLGTSKGIECSETLGRVGRMEEPVICRFPDCSYKVLYYSRLRPCVSHEQMHFGKPGNFRCLEEGCKATAKKFADLRRHTLGSHCTMS